MGAAAMSLGGPAGVAAVRMGMVGENEPGVTDGALSKIMSYAYKARAQVGCKSTADAVRYESLTGQLLSPSGHVQKAGEIVTSLTHWIASHPGASPADIQAAQTVLQDTIKALSGR